MSCILPLHRIDRNDLNLAGGKALSLSEMAQGGLPVPEAFVVTTEAFNQFITSSQLEERIHNELVLLDKTNPQSLAQISQRIRNHILTSPLPEVLAEDIFNAYESLTETTRSAVVAVRCSEPVIEPALANKPLFLNITGDVTVGEMIKEVWTTPFTPQNLKTSSNPLKKRLAVIVQTMINADKSGFLHTIDNHSENKQVMVIEAIYGDGEYFAEHEIKPDRYIIDKNTLNLTKTIANPQVLQLKLTKQGMEEVIVQQSLQKKQKLNTGTINLIARYGQQIAKLHYYPQSAEWILSKEKLFFVQTQPLLTHEIPLVSHTQTMPPIPTPVNPDLQAILEGFGVVPGFITGHVHVFEEDDDPSSLTESQIVVVKEVIPEIMNHLRRCKAIIADKGAHDSDAALLLTEAGIPAVIGTNKASRVLKTGDVITLNGSTGLIYRGHPNNGTSAHIFSRDEHLSHITHHETASLVHTGKTHLAVDIPTGKYAGLPMHYDAVAFLRGELIISELNIHPKKLLAEEKIETLIEYLTNRLTKVGDVSGSRPIYYRLSDFQSHTLRKLEGGAEYETFEANPFLGLRGTSRLLLYEEVLKAELKAVLRSRGNKANVHVVVPIVRNVNEFSNIKNIIKKIDHTNKIEVWLGASSAANLISAPEFIHAGVNGFIVDLPSITALTLGVDPENTDVYPLFNEVHPAVLWLLHHAAAYVRNHHVQLIVCSKSAGQYPDIMEKLIRAGVTGFSVPPDMVESTRKFLSKLERT